MGILRGNLLFITGTICGISIAQNYNVPNMKKVVHEALFTAKKVEEKYRKPKKPGENDAV